MTDPRHPDRADLGDDDYRRLRPMRATPADELCHCAGTPDLMPQEHLSANPIACFDCAREVPPERIGYPSALAEQLARWRSFQYCVYYLWLDSAEFEAFARAALEDPHSVLNPRSFAMVRALNDVRRTYLYWFQHIGKADFVRLTHCPNCTQRLTLDTARWVCQPCAITVANS